MSKNIKEKSYYFLIISKNVDKKIMFQLKKLKTRAQFFLYIQMNENQFFILSQLEKLKNLQTKKK